MVKMPPNGRRTPRGMEEMSERLQPLGSQGGFRGRLESSYSPLEVEADGGVGVGRDAREEGMLLGDGFSSGDPALAKDEIPAHLKLEEVALFTRAVIDTVERESVAAALLTTDCAESVSAGLPALAATARSRKGRTVPMSIVREMERGANRKARERNPPQTPRISRHKDLVGLRVWQKSR